MEKSRAIELLKLAVPIKTLTQQEYSDFVEAVNMGMDALEQPTSPIATDTNVGDTIYRKAAIDAVNTIGYIATMPDGDKCIRRSAVKYTLSMLPSAQPEQTDCEYCHEDSAGYAMPLEKNCHAFIRFGMDGWELSLKAKGWHGSAKIKYCPMCGRRLIDG